ncbi:MAG: ThuA domain-containing protein [Actinomycetes bacterium]
MTPLRRAAPLAVTGALLAGGVLPLSAAGPASAQEAGERVLVFSRTTGFRHTSIEVGVAAVEQLGQENGFEVTATEDPTVFTDATLAEFDAVVWLNTTGNVLDEPQRAAFERYVRGGGAFVGVHSAADTEYTNDFYTELLAGARFLAHPVQQPGTLLKEPPDHPSTAHLGDTWTLPFEEFYSFTQSPRPASRVLLTIDEASYEQDPNTSQIPRGPEIPEGVTGVMGDHPMSWCLDVGEGRSWYTALGHEAYLYALPDYRRHLLGGILTAVGRIEADCSVVAAEEAPPSTGQAPAEQAPAPAVEAARSLPETGAGGAAGVGLLVVALSLALRRRAAERRP